MTAATDSVHRSGLVDAWLHRCGTKPWRSYLLVWLALVVLAIVLGFVGFTRMELSLLPPPPEGIPYSDYLAGGNRAIDGALELDSQKLPTFEPTLQRKDVGLLVMPARDASPARLIAITRGTLIAFGWPNLWLTWGSQQAWDVSDPTVPFRKCDDYFALGGVYWHPQSLSFSSLSDGGSLGRTLNIESAGAYSVLALPQLLAAFVVISSHALDRSRRRWRELRRRCTECGHARDPSRTDAACTECGSESCQNECTPRDAKRLARPGLVCGIIFVGLLTIWIVLQFRNPSVERYGSIEEKIAARQSMSRACVRPVYEESRGYGWPMHFIYKQVNHWYAFGGPEAVKTPCPDPFVRHDGGYLVFSLKFADSSIATLWTIYWPPALLQIGLLQIIATILTGALVFVAAMRRRWALIKAAPSTAAAHRTPASASSRQA